MSKYLASVGFIAINGKAPHANAAKLFHRGAEAQRIIGETGDVFHPEVDHKRT